MWTDCQTLSRLKCQLCIELWCLEMFHCTLLADVVNCPQQIICVPTSSPLVEPRRVTIYPGFVGMVNAFCTSLITNSCCCLVTKSCSTICNSEDWSPPCSFVHGIFPARIKKWVAIFLSRWTSQPRDLTHISCTGRGTLSHWVTREAQFLNYALLNL